MNNRIHLSLAVLPNEGEVPALSPREVRKSSREGVIKHWLCLRDERLDVPRGQVYPIEREPVRPEDASKRPLLVSHSEVRRPNVAVLVQDLERKIQRLLPVRDHAEAVRESRKVDLLHSHSLESLGRDQRTIARVSLDDRHVAFPSVLLHTAPGTVEEWFANVDEVNLLEEPVVNHGLNVFQVKASSCPDVNPSASAGERHRIHKVGSGVKHPIAEQIINVSLVAVEVVHLFLLLGSGFVPLGGRRFQERRGEHVPEVLHVAEKKLGCSPGGRE